jgi:hypothetical protein
LLEVEAKLERTKLLATAPRELSLAKLQTTLEEARQLADEVTQLVSPIRTFQRKAAETDPSKKSYGPKMLEKVTGVCSRFDLLQPVVLDLKDTLEDAISSAAAAEEARQTAEAALRSEEERQRAAAEAARIAEQELAAQEAARRETEELAARAIEAERLRLERQTKREAEAQARAGRVELARRAHAEAERERLEEKENKARDERRKQTEDLLARHKDQRQAAESLTAQAAAAAAAAAAPAPASKVEEVQSAEELGLLIGTAGWAVVCVLWYPRSRSTGSLQEPAAKPPLLLRLLRQLSTQATYRDVVFLSADAGRVDASLCAPGIAPSPPVPVSFDRDTVSVSFYLNGARAAEAAGAAAQPEWLTAQLRAQMEASEEGLVQEAIRCVCAGGSCGCWQRCGIVLYGCSNGVAVAVAAYGASSVAQHAVCARCGSVSVS